MESAAKCAPPDSSARHFSYHGNGRARQAYPYVLAQYSRSLSGRPKYTPPPQPSGRQLCNVIATLYPVHKLVFCSPLTKYVLYMCTRELNTRHYLAEVSDVLPFRRGSRWGLGYTLSKHDGRPNEMYSDLKGSVKILIFFYQNYKGNQFWEACPIRQMKCIKAQSFLLPVVDRPVDPSPICLHPCREPINQPRCCILHSAVQFFGITINPVHFSIPPYRSAPSQSHSGYKAAILALSRPPQRRGLCFTVSLGLLEWLTSTHRDETRAQRPQTGSVTEIFKPPHFNRLSANSMLTGPLSVYCTNTTAVRQQNKPYFCPYPR